MIEILSGTNRPQARSLEIAHYLQRLYLARGAQADVLDLKTVGLELVTGAEYAQNQPKPMLEACERVARAAGIVVVCPEYNGSMPGALKHFLDHLPFPRAWEFRPFCLVGLGGRFGGLRPVEHLQQVFGYRNGFIYPERVFINDVWTKLKDGVITDPAIVGLLETQTDGFIRFVKALETSGLHANSRGQSEV